MGNVPQSRIQGGARHVRVFLVALRDEFGFGEKRADRAYHELTDIWTAINAGSLSIEDMWREHDAVGKNARASLAL